MITYKSLCVSCEEIRAIREGSRQIERPFKRWSHDWTGTGVVYDGKENTYKYAFKMPRADGGLLVPRYQLNDYVMLREPWLSVLRYDGGKFYIYQADGLLDERYNPPASMPREAVRYIAKIVHIAAKDGKDGKPPLWVYTFYLISR